MNKRIVIVICIVVALASFLGGVYYRYEEYAPIIKGLQEDKESLQTQFDKFFAVPVDIDLAYKWLAWADEQYQHRIDNEIFTEQYTLEFYQKGIDMFSEIKDIYIEYEAKYYK